jgi:hypothetical protein
MHRIYIYLRLHLELNKFTETTDTAANSRGSSSTKEINIMAKLLPHLPSTTSNDLSASTAFPNTNRLALNAVTSTERASVFAVLGDFDLLDLFTEGRTVTGSVFTDYTDFLSVLSLGWMDEEEREGENTI